MSKLRTRLRVHRPEQVSQQTKKTESEEITDGPLFSPPTFGLGASALPNDEGDSNPLSNGGMSGGGMGAAPGLPNNPLGGKASAYSSSLGFGAGLYGELGPEAKSRAEFFSETLNDIRAKELGSPKLDLQAAEANLFGPEGGEGIGKATEGSEGETPQEAQQGMAEDEKAQKKEKEEGKAKKEEGKEENDKAKKELKGKEKGKEKGDKSGADGLKKEEPKAKGEEASPPPAKQTANISGLPGEIASRLEAVLGMDLSGVKIKKNSSEAVAHGAKALAKGGNEVHFAPGQFNPGSLQGQRMIGHEFGHLKDQAQGKVKKTGEELGKAVNTSKDFEASADKVATEFTKTNWQPPTPPSSGSASPAGISTHSQVPKVSQFMRDESYGAYSSLLGIVQARKAAAQAGLDAKKQAVQAAVQAEKQNVQAALQAQAARVDGVVQGGVSKVQEVKQAKVTDAQSQKQDSTTKVNTAATAETEKVNALVDKKKEDLTQKGDKKAEKITEHAGKEVTRMASETASNIGKLDQAVSSASSGASNKEGADKLISKAQSEASQLSSKMQQLARGVIQTVRSEGQKNSQKLKQEAQQGAGKFDETREKGAKAITDKKEDSVKAIEGNVDEFVSTIEGDTGTVVSEISGKAGEIKPAILQMGEGAMASLDQLAEAFAAALDRANQQSMSGIDGFINSLAEVAMDEELISQITGSVEAFFAQQEGQANSAVGSAQSQIGQTSAGVSQDASAGVDKLQSGMDQVSTEFGTKADTKLNEVKSENSKVAGEAKDQMGTVSTNMEPEFDNAITKAETKWDENVTKVSEKMTEKVDDGLEEENKTVSNFQSEIQAAFSKLPEKKDERSLGEKFLDFVKSAASFVFGIVEGLGLAILKLGQAILDLLSLLKEPINWLIGALAIIGGAILLIGAAALLGITVGTLLMIIGAVIGVIIALACLHAAIFTEGLSARERGNLVGEGIFEIGTAFIGTGVWSKVGKLGGLSKWAGAIGKSKNLIKMAGNGKFLPGLGRFMRMGINVPADDFARLGTLLEKGGDMNQLSKVLGMASDGKQASAILDMIEATGDAAKVAEVLSYGQDSSKIINFFRRGIGPGKLLNMAQKTNNTAGLITALDNVGDTRRFLDLGKKVKELDGVIDLVNNSGDANRVIELLEQANKAGNLRQVVAEAAGNVNTLENLVNGGDKATDTLRGSGNISEAVNTVNALEEGTDAVNSTSRRVEDAANSTPPANQVENVVDASSDAGKLDNVDPATVNQVENVTDASADAGKLDDVPTPAQKPPPETWHPNTTEEVAFGDFKYSQETANGMLGDGTPVDELAEAMRRNGWDYTKEPPTMIEMPDGSLVSMDHRRLVAAERAGITEVPIQRVSGKTSLDPEYARARDFYLPKKTSARVRGELAELMGRSEPLPKGYVAQNWEEAIMIRSARQGGGFPLTGSAQTPRLTYSRGPVAKALEGPMADSYRQLTRAGMRPVEEAGNIRFMHEGNVVAEIVDGQLVFKYAGFGGDIVVDPSRATTFIGKYIEETGSTQTGTRYFLGSPDPTAPVTGLPEGSFVRGTGYDVPPNNLNSLDVPSDEYRKMLSEGLEAIRNDPKYRDLPEEDILRLGRERGNEEFWRRYNQPFLEESFKRGDDVRLISDPETFSTGYYGRELDEVARPGGLAERYGYSYEEASKTWKRIQNAGDDLPGGSGTRTSGPNNTPANGNAGSGGNGLDNATGSLDESGRIIDGPSGGFGPNDYVEDLANGPDAWMYQRGGIQELRDAELFYNKMTTELTNGEDVAQIVENTGLPQDVLARVRSHLFDEQHWVVFEQNGEATEVFGRFTPDAGIADLWKSAMDGSINQHPEKLEALKDLLAHEFIESRLMEEGLPFRSPNSVTRNYPQPGDGLGAHDMSYSTRFSQALKNAKPGEVVTPFNWEKYYGIPYEGPELSRDFSNIDEVIDYIVTTVNQHS